MLDIGPIMQVNITGLVADQTEKAQTATVTVTKLETLQTTGIASVSNCAFPARRVVAVGAGVGVPLGILFLLSLWIALLYRWRWNRLTRTRLMPELSSANRARLPGLKAYETDGMGVLEKDSAGVHEVDGLSRASAADMTKI